MDDTFYLVGKGVEIAKRGGSARMKGRSRSLLWPRVYDALRRQGKSKSSAAAISNAHWNKYRRWGKAGDPGPKSKAAYDRRKRLRKQLGLGDVHANIATPNLSVAYQDEWVDTYTDEEIETIATEAATIWHVGADGVAVER